MEQNRAWKPTRLKFLLESPIVDGPHETPDFVEDGIPFLSADSIQNNRLILENTRFITPEAHAIYSKKCLPRKGDVLLTKAASVGKVALVETDEKFNIWSPIAVIRPSHRLLPKYLYYQMTTENFLSQVLRMANVNTQSNIGMKQIAEASVYVPSIDDQKCIVQFLDRETAKLDRLVEKKQRLLELLQEKRQALITQAVTRGLDPNVPMKDSGIPWLGDVPAHWTITPIKRVARVGYGLGQPPKLSDEGIPIIRATNISQGRISDQNMIYAHLEDLPLDRAPLLETGEILVVRSGAYTGDSAIVTEKYKDSAPGYDLRVSPHSVSPEFLAFTILSGVVQHQITIEKLRAAQPHLNAEDLGNCLVPLPGEDEQKHIAVVIRRYLNNIDRAIERLSEQTERIKEYRQTLISAAVTGQIDVRTPEPEGVFTS